jgi:hypothetical protein
VLLALDDTWLDQSLLSVNKIFIMACKIKHNKEKKTSRNAAGSVSCALPCYKRAGFLPAQIRRSTATQPWNGKRRTGIKSLVNVGHMR